MCVCQILFVFQSPLEPNTPQEMCDHIAKHGDGVKDIGTNLVHEL